jgi:hypothetical protein
VVEFQYNIVLNLPPDTEAKLLERARETGMDAEALTLEALREKLASDEASPMLGLDEWHARFDAIVASMPASNPNTDFSRESVYDDRGE